MKQFKLNSKRVLINLFYLLLGIGIGLLTPKIVSEVSTINAINKFIKESKLSKPIEISLPSYAYQKGIDNGKSSFGVSFGFSGEATQLISRALRDTVIAKKLLNDNDSLVRGNSIYIMTIFDETLSHEVASMIKSIILNDKCMYVRRLSLQAFDDPFSFTAPHLFLTADEYLQLIKSDSILFILASELINKERILNSSSNVNSINTLTKYLINELKSPEGPRRLAAYHSLAGLNRNHEYLKDEILGVETTPNNWQFEYTIVPNFFLNGSTEKLVLLSNKLLELKIEEEKRPRAVMRD